MLPEPEVVAVTSWQEPLTRMSPEPPVFRSMFPSTVTSLRRTFPLPETRTEAPPVEISLSTKKSPDPLTPASKSSQEIPPIRTVPDPLTLPSKSSQASWPTRMLPLPLHWAVKSRLSISPVRISPLPETFKAREPEA